MIVALFLEIVAIVLLEVLILPEIRFHLDHALMDRLARDHEYQDWLEGRS